jgi:hypothetical protein
MFAAFLIFFHIKLYFSPYQIVTEYPNFVYRHQCLLIYFPSGVYGRKLCKMFLLSSLLAVGIQDSSISIVTILQVSGSGAHPTFCAMGTGCKRARA